MPLLLQPKQFANLAYTPCPGGQINGNIKFVVNPKQQIQGFPIEFLDKELTSPNGFANSGSFEQEFNIDGYVYVPPNWSNHGWQLMIHKSFTQISDKVFQFSWGPANYILNVTLS
jgi:hypothetical protein